MKLCASLSHISTRRRHLRHDLASLDASEYLDESCVPSYCHPNGVVAFAAWWRLLVAAKLGRAFAPPGTILDFGASVGELAALLPTAAPYEFVERDENLATVLGRNFPRARRRELGQLPPHYYAAVFALDSLEHNEDRQSILERLQRCLRDDGVLVLSGPTENLLYRIGRRIAGFSGHYHLTNIYHVESDASLFFRKTKSIRGPFGLPLFLVSVWKNPPGQ